MEPPDSKPVLKADDRGIACALGSLWIDPWRPVKTAVVTHGHADHARPGSGTYHAAASSRPLLERRLPGENIIYHDFGESFILGDAQVSLHPAGHVLGSAQVRVEPTGGGPVWVAAGDYKRDADPTCETFELLKCDGFITEATFALPAYKWDPPEHVAAQMLDWWLANRDAGKPSVLFTYALGKAQRVLGELAAEITRRGEDPERFEALTHGAAEPLVEAYRSAGVRMLPTRLLTDAVEARGKEAAGQLAGTLTIAPPSAAGSPWMRRFGPSADTAFVSGWMRIRGVRRRRGYDRGFVLSDHADWSQLIRTIDETGAKTVLATHGSSEILARYLRETRHLDARVLETAYVGEDGSEEPQ